MVWLLRENLQKGQEQKGKDGFTFSVWGNRRKHVESQGDGSVTIDPMRWSILWSKLSVGDARNGHGSIKHEKRPVQPHKVVVALFTDPFLSKSLCQLFHCCKELFAHPPRSLELDGGLWSKMTVTLEGGAQIKNGIQNSKTSCVVLPWLSYFNVVQFLCSGWLSWTTGTAPWKCTQTKQGRQSKNVQGHFITASHNFFRRSCTGTPSNWATHQLLVHWGPKNFNFKWKLSLTYAKTTEKRQRKEKEDEKNEKNENENIFNEKSTWKKKKENEPNEKWNNEKMIKRRKMKMKNEKRKTRKMENSNYSQISKFFCFTRKILDDFQGLPLLLLLL